jgi:hypothetical protein
MIVTNAPAGAEVYLDNTPAGFVHPDGSLVLPALGLGTHTITLKKDTFKPLTREFTITAGQQIDLDGTMQPIAGTLQVKLSPAEVTATLSWRRESDGVSQPFTGNSISLPEGTYTIQGRAPDYEGARTTARIVAGRNAVAVLTFKKSGRKDQGKVFSLADVEKTGGWTVENKVLTRIGGNYAMLPIGSSPGTYSFTAMMLKGKRLDWVIGFVDGKNNVTYELNSDKLERTAYIDGKKYNVKPPLKVKVDAWIQITVEVTQNSIVTSIQQEDNNYPAIDKFSDPKINLLQGKFGFRVPGKDRLAVGAFTFK